MAEVTLDLKEIPKPLAYEELSEHIDNVLAGIDDDVTEMATIAALVHHAFGWLWTGFYRMVEPDRLMRVGPYQGTLGCLEIAVGRGVCGTAARERRTIIVPNVDEFPGHISCDARSRSEIVVPVFNASGDVIAVLDVDADVVGAFTDEDRIGLEKIVARFTRQRA